MTAGPGLPLAVMTWGMWLTISVVGLIIVTMLVLVVDTMVIGFGREDPERRDQEVDTPWGDR